MKKAKIMFSLLFVVAAVGAGLALKARVYTDSYCVAPITTNICTTCVIGNLSTTGTQVHYVHTIDCNACNGWFRCTNTGVIVPQ